MTISAGDYLLGAYTTEGDLIVIPSGIPANGQYCVFARTGDHRRVAMLATPMRVEGAVGFLGTAANGLTVAFAPSAAGPALCIPVQSLGYDIPWMAYPPFAVDVNVTSVVAQPGRDAFIGAWADWLAADSFQDTLDPEGVQRNWSVRNMNMAAQYPFLEANPHDLEDGSPALSLGGVVPGASDGVWFHAEPMPLIMSRRTCIGPGPLHEPAYWPFQPTPGAPNDLPMDVRSTRQLFTNLKAWLDFAPSGDIRLNLRMFVVVMVGRTADFNWAPPIQITHPSAETMDCLSAAGGLQASGIGTACQALTMWGGIPSLGCFCTCEAIAFWQCAGLDFGVNALKRSNKYYACGEYPDRRFRTIGIHGGDTREITAAWPYGQEPSEVTAARVLAAFGATGTVNEWVAAEFASRFGTAPLTIATGTDSEARLGTFIECHCTPAGISPTVPDELAGTQPLPADDVTICFPESGTPPAPVIPRIQLDNIDGWRGRAEQIFRYALTDADAYACGKNPDLDDYLGLWYITNKKTAYRWVCALWASWEGLEARMADILTGSVLTNLPLRDDCFAGGYDTATGEYVFGYDFPANLYDPEGGLLDYCSVDLAQALVSVCSGTPLGDTDLIPPRDNPTAWTLIGSGGGAPTCPPVTEPVDCMIFPDHPACDEDPEQSPPLCRVLDEDWFWLRNSVTYPKYYLLKKPQV